MSTDSQTGSAPGTNGRSGALGLSGRAAADLVDRLGRLDLLILDDAALHLTPEGRREAVQYRGLA